MSKGKSAIDDHRISILSSRRGSYYNCGCGKVGGPFENGVDATHWGYMHVKAALEKS